MKHLLTLLAIALLTACVSTGTFQSYQDDMEARLDGSITQEEFAALNAERDERIRQQEEDALNLGDALLGGGGLVTAVAGAIFGVNRKTKFDIHRERDKKYTAPGGDTML